ncbi:PP2C family protein-serine/threonine phosphatase [Lysinibacter cavernae]|uniref:Protein phosphatase n=1 Tax=Lysinibacter cavernae TaxID=1640652 RepID=A0A7X5R0Z4_9MICO|nr:protein phosphatase 2C domain-containing protein [Lysinibacter cavernae]NIH53614.1 protein phosphatase [Lysinibacter cavernae]
MIEQQTGTIPWGSGDLAVSLSWAARTDTGLRRAQNEDSLVAVPPVFAVADGMGGHAAGDVASASVVTALSHIRHAPVQPANIQAALRVATQQILAAAAEAGASGGATCVGFAATEQGGLPYWLVYNVGDSRAYSYDDATLTRISVDHSIVQELVDAGEITAEEAEQHPKRNVITRAIGFEEAPIPDYWLLPVIEGSALLCCSDGLTKELTDAQIAEHFAAGSNPGEVADSLLAAALMAGGHDNITVIVIVVGQIVGARATGTTPAVAGRLDAVVSATEVVTEAEEWDTTVPRR